MPDAGMPVSCLQCSRTPPKDKEPSPFPCPGLPFHLKSVPPCFDPALPHFCPLLFGSFPPPRGLNPPPLFHKSPASPEFSANVPEPNNPVDIFLHRPCPFL